jgi:hypothetical protein
MSTSEDCEALENLAVWLRDLSAPGDAPRSAQILRRAADKLRRIEAAVNDTDLHSDEALDVIEDILK